MKFSNEIVRLILTVSKFLMGDFTVYFYGLFFFPNLEKKETVSVSAIWNLETVNKKKETVQILQKISQNYAVLYGFHLQQNYGLFQTVQWANGFLLF